MMKSLASPMIVKWLITIITLLFVMVDFTSWFLSFAVELIFAAVLLYFLWLKPADPKIG